MHRAIKVLALALVSAVMLSGTVFADMSGDNGKVIPAATVRIPVKHVITGDKYDGDDVFDFILTAEDAKNPLPPGSNGRSKSVSVKGAADPDFGDIVLEYPDTYYYTISRPERKYENLTIDYEVYRVMIAKYNDGSTQMVIWNSGGDKAEEIIYADEYTVPEVTKVPDPEKPDAPKKPQTPKTGDEEIIGQLKIYAGGSILALAALLVIVRKRREESHEE